MQTTKSANTYVIRLEKGEELISSLKSFCEKENIHGAYFQMIGGCTELELAFYDLATKEYMPQTFGDDFEAVSVLGDISVDESGQVTIHAHGVFSDRAMKTVGGHIMKAVITGTGEIFLQLLSTPLTRRLDSQIGLKLLDL
jgi:predicted DNA-binding protein with PD1-like motif